MALALVAEDDQLFSSLIATRLREQGLEVACAYDGEEALELARTKHPDVLLLDILMPKKDGFAVMAELRASSETMKIPILVATNLSDKSSADRCKELGAADILVKANSSPTEIAQHAMQLLPK